MPAGSSPLPDPNWDRIPVMTTDKALHWRDLPTAVLSLLRDGTVIPAHPLALGPDRQFDEQSQRAISRYYLDAGSGGLAVGVHSTQFAIREVGLYRPVLELAIETAREWSDRLDPRGPLPSRSPPDIS